MDKIAIEDRKTVYSRSANTGQAVVGKQPLAELFDYRESYRALAGDTELARCLASRPDLHVELSGDQAMQPILVTGSYRNVPGIELSHWGFRITLSPSHGMLPVRIEKLVLADGQIRLEQWQEVTKWKDLGAGLYAPLELKGTFYDWGGTGTDGELAVEYQVLVDEPKSKWNAELSPQTFDRSFPLGFSVYDDIKKTRYIEGQWKPGDNLKALAARAREMAPAPRAGPSRTLGPSAPGSWSRMAAGGLAALAVAGMGFLVFRKHRAKRAGTTP